MNQRRTPSITQQVDIDPEVLRQFEAKAGFGLKEHAVFVCYGGSRATNTHFELDTTELGIDDTDVCCVVAPPARVGPFEFVNIKVDPWDVRILSLPAFVRSLTEGDPSAVSMLWTRPEDQFVLDAKFEPFVWFRANFLTKAFYAKLKDAAKSHRRAILNCPDTDYEGFLGAKKRALAQRRRFDTRHAAQYIRTLKVCCELAQRSDFTLYRMDDEGLLKAIKRGHFKLPEVIAMGHRLERELATAEARLDLPDEVDPKRVDPLLKSACFFKE